MEESLNRKRDKPSEPKLHPRKSEVYFWLRKSNSGHLAWRASVWRNGYLYGSGHSWVLRSNNSVTIQPLHGARGSIRRDERPPLHVPDSCCLQTANEFYKSQNTIEGSKSQFFVKAFGLLCLQPENVENGFIESLAPPEFNGPFTLAKGPFLDFQKHENIWNSK